jgi:hypothetical protein
MIIYNILLNMMKCVTIDRNLNGCRGNATNGKFCKIHSYMIEYTDKMVEDAKPCGTCHKTHFMGEYTTCEACRKRGEDNRIKKKEKEPVIKCVKEGCSFKKSQENDYCGKHQLYVFINETEELGFKTCKNAVRGCRAQLEDNYKYSACKDCLEKEREKDNKRRGIPIKETIIEKQCSVCSKICKKEMFQGLHGETQSCTNCREANKRADEKRDKEHVNELARINSLKPERKIVKNDWKEANYEKVAMYCIQHRKKMIEEDIDKYHSHKLETMKKWRDSHPEKVKEINEKNKNNIDRYYQIYKNSAITKQLMFEITKEEYLLLVVSPCNYCGIIQEKGFNGIDRLNSSIGYVKNNCVSCCAMCNYMKGCLNKDIFIQRVEHISTYNKFIEGKLFPNAFQDYTPVYSSYITSAKNKKLAFKINKFVFMIITDRPCYMCGKKPTREHQNGLDRIDSSIGYLENNVYSCCGNCNYMKKNYSYKRIIDKCVMIYKEQIIKNTLLQNEITNEVTNVESEVPKEKRTIIKGHKLNPEEIKHNNRIRKQKQRELLKEHYGNEEYNKIHAKQIAENRKKRINDSN